MTGLEGMKLFGVILLVAGVPVVLVMGYYKIADKLSKYLDKKIDKGMDL